MWTKCRSYYPRKPTEFFFLTIKSRDPEKINKYFERLNNETKMIIHNIVELAWYLRGGMSYHDLMNTSFIERQIISDFITTRMEKIKDHHYPVY